MMETQFRTGFAELVRAICRVEGMAEPAKHYPDLDTQYGAE